MATTAEASKAKYPADDGAEVMLIGDGLKAWMSAEEADVLAEQLRQSAAEWRARVPRG